jgi:8-oxo-dGTP diphosphatase
MKLAAFGIVSDAEGRVLLCRRADNGLWNLPGGGLEAGESPWEAVVREVQEEACVDVAVGSLAGVYRIRHENLLVFTFRCAIVSGEPCESEESTEVDWFFSDALPEGTLPRHAERVRDALAETSCVMKEQP